MPNFGIQKASRIDYVYSSSSMPARENDYVDIGSLVFPLTRSTAKSFFHAEMQQLFKELQLEPATIIFNSWTLGKSLVPFSMFVVQKRSRKASSHLCRKASHSSAKCFTSMLYMNAECTCSRTRAILQVLQENLFPNGDCFTVYLRN